MSRFPTHPIAAGILLGLVVPAAVHCAEPANPDANLAVIVFNYAAVPTDVLAEAQGFTQKVFQHAGVGIEWIDPSSLAGQREWHEPQEGPKFVMRIVPDSMLGPWPNHHALLGFALLPVDGGMGSLAGAYHERVQRLSRRLGGDSALVLGYVIAHELGHLLLGAQSHFHSGIMSYPFDRSELRLASRGLLRFTPSQAKRIHERLQEQSQSPDRRNCLGSME